jgi:tetrahydromethanopterin S-methyltransferase subunit G
VINSNTTDSNLAYFQGLTSALLTNGTSLCNGSTGLMTGQVNITLNPNEFCYVLDEFNLTEGVTRERSPLTLRRENNNEWHIDNNLSDTISGVYIEFPEYCDNLLSIQYQSDSGAFVKDVNYECINNRVKINASENLEIENAVGSNIFLLTLKGENSDIDSSSSGSSVVSTPANVTDTQSPLETIKENTNEFIADLEDRIQETTGKEVDIVKTTYWIIGIIVASLLIILIIIKNNNGK